MSPAKRFVAVRVFPWLVILAGSLFIVTGVREMRLASASEEWPSTTGTVLSATVDSSSSSSGSSSRTYHASVAYTYRVAGSDFEGTTISYGAYGTGDYERAARIAARYEAGEPVRVYYQPDDPAESVLEPGSHSLPWASLAFGAVFALVGAGMAFLMPALYPRGGD